MERFLEKLQPEGDCLIWTGTSSSGYGLFWIEGGMKSAHRWIYRARVGPIPEPLHVHHTCGVKMCMNVEHMQLVTRNEHMRMQPNPMKTHCKRGHPKTPENTYYGVNAQGNVTRSCKICMRLLEKERRGS